MSGYRAPVSAPYRPGQPQWPDNRPQRPDRPPPIQFQQDNMPPPPPNKTLQWAMRICGLVVIAVVSGLVWYYITNDDTSNQGTGSEESTAPQPQGVYQFTPHEDMPEPNTATNCAEHSYSDIKGFFEETPCAHLTRQLFVTKVGDRTVYTSVSVVIMPDEEKANELRQFTDKEGSGNVSDVVRDRLVKIQGLDRLSKSGGYASKQSGRDVIIIEADFAPKDRSGDKDADEDVLDEVCDDALRMAVQLDKGAGTG
jgi:hypothetical protein